ncbi:helix-turn-helix transcriptional regulator [Rhodococcus aerolatus]
MAFRSKLGLTPAQLAILSGVSTESIWSWEAGRYSPAAPAAKRLADALRVGVSHLTTISPSEATLTDLRHWQGMTADDAAAAAGLNKRQIGRLEQYVVAPKPEVREALARVYQVTPEQFDAAWLRGREAVLGDFGL